MASQCAKFQADCNEFASQCLPVDRYATYSTFTAIVGSHGRILLNLSYLSPSRYDYLRHISFVEPSLLNAFGATSRTGAIV